MNEIINQKSKSDLILALLAIAGLLAFLLLHDSIFPWSGIKIQHDQSEVTKIVEAKLKEFGIESTGYESSIKFSRDTDLIRYLQQEFGVAQADSLLREEVPGYYWSITWKKPKQKDTNDSLVVAVTSEETGSDKSDITMQLNQKGELLAWQYSISDEQEGVNLTHEQARARADSIMFDQLGIQAEEFAFETSISKQMPARTDHTFRWRKKEHIPDIPVRLEISIVGDQVGGYKLSYNPPEKKESPIPELLRVIPLLLLILIYAFLFLRIIIKKLRTDEINLKHGIAFGVLGGVCVSLTIVLPQNISSFIELIIPVIIAGPFTGFILAIVVSASDAVAREAWHEKLFTLDTLRRGKILHRQFGHSLLRGIAVGLLILGVSTIFLKLASQFTPIGFYNS